MEFKTLFEKLFFAKTEDELEKIVHNLPEIFKQENWKPIGNNESNFGIIENQQSNPIAALVEKITNSIDAMLMRKCYELNIDPKSKEAPKSMIEAVTTFFPNHKSWDLNTFRRKQAEEIQILADGPPRDTSVIIYDNGEGQNPEDFENTFLSLVRGNKNQIMFVQGKYNMGGSGAIVFCGKKGYQLIGSKKFNNKGNFGFTLIREHPFEKGEENFNKNTWYEYLTIGGGIPSFQIDSLDLKLHNRSFTTGTVIKMYSYQFPSGYSGFAQDLNQSLNEFLFEPLLPILTVDKKERYPNNLLLENTSFGLKRRLQDEGNYVEESFSEEYADTIFGKMRVTCYVFRAKQKDKDVKSTKDDIKRRFFKNGMSVLFSMNGQVQGHFTTEFITRSLKFNLLKDYLLVHVDCTTMKYDFRKELFMASRDRLKQGAESNFLRDYLTKKLRQSALDDINRKRKESIGLESEDTNDLIKSFAKNLPKDSELFKLLQNTLKLDEKKDNKAQIPEKRIEKQKDKDPFNPKRFPTYFKYSQNKNGETPVLKLPINGEKIIKFNTDVENQYFDRIEEPGELIIALVKIKRNISGGGDKPGTENEIAEILNIVKSSPKDGTIKLNLNPTEELKVGDEMEISVSLTGPDQNREELLLIKISEAEASKDEVPKIEEDNNDKIGLPELVKVVENQWPVLAESGIQMDWNTVMHPLGEGDTLEKIYVNLDSNVYLRHRKKLKSEDQIMTSQKKYLASVYFHTLFLYMITKRRNYQITRTENGQDESISTDTYIKDIFDSYYSDFLLNFGMEQLINALDE